MKKFLVVGSGGREAAIVNQLAKTDIVYAVMAHPNPTIIDACEKSGGEYIIGNVCDGKFVSEFAYANFVDYAVVNNDNILVCGVVDDLRDKKIPTFGPTKMGAKIEWSKTYAREVVDKVAPQYNPKYRIVTNEDDLDLCLNWFGGIDLVVKPDGLTSGKGVKVMGPHLKDYNEAREYALALIEKDGSVVLEEKLNGYEFTVMGITDGKDLILSPVTYDYPFRYENDEGPGTGGMGCITTNDGLLPFLSNEDMDRCKDIMQKVIHYLNNTSYEFNGILNAGFFKQNDGSLRVMEFNSRIGDPEALNIMALLNVSMADITKACTEQKLSGLKQQLFRSEASIVVYLTSVNYALISGHDESSFTVNTNELDSNCTFICANCMFDGEKYVSNQASRLAAFVMTGSDYGKIIHEVYKNIDRCVEGNVDYRKDIGSKFLTIYG